MHLEIINEPSASRGDGRVFLRRKTDESCTLTIIAHHHRAHDPTEFPRGRTLANRIRIHVEA